MISLCQTEMRCFLQRPQVFLRKILALERVGTLSIPILHEVIAHGTDQNACLDARRLTNIEPEPNPELKVAGWADPRKGRQGARGRKYV